MSQNEINVDVVRDMRNIERDKNIKDEYIEQLYVETWGEIRQVHTVKEIYSDEIASTFYEISCLDKDDRKFILRDKNVEVDKNNNPKEKYKPGSKGIFKLQIHIEHKFKGKISINFAGFTEDKK